MEEEKVKQLMILRDNLQYQLSVLKENIDDTEEALHGISKMIYDNCQHVWVRDPWDYDCGPASKICNKCRAPDNKIKSP